MWFSTSGFFLSSLPSLPSLPFPFFIPNMSSPSFPPFIGYPTGSTETTAPVVTAAAMLPDRPYFNMKIEDFPPYAALGERPVLQGPEPYYPIYCGCDRYRIAENMCICSLDCQQKPLYAWAKAHPAEFAQKQEEMRRWRRLARLWSEQVDAVNNKWLEITKHVRYEFECLQDQESPIGCADCERYHRSYCTCLCEACGSKYCVECKMYDDY